MICCLCGHRFYEGEVFIKVTMHRLATSKMTGEELHVKETLEDGSREKVACPTCPVMAGAPLSLIGAEYGYNV